MLSNQLYIARISQPTWDIDAAGNWPPLVDEDTFWRCQSLLRTDGLVVPKERNNPDFPLRGFVTCAHCKSPLTGSWSKGRNQRYAYYHCPPKAHCRRTNVPRHELEAKFLGLLEQLRPRPEFLARQRFQSLLFPEGMQLENGEVRTAVSHSFFNELERFVPLEERLVSPAGFEPALLP